MGIQNIVVNPVDVPTTQKDQKRKSDPVDSNKLGRSLRSNELKGIYIPRPETLEDWTIIRVRFTIVKDMVRQKQRIKSLLYLYGIEYPDEFQNANAHWSKRFINWLKTVQLQYTTGTDALNLLIKEAVSISICLNIDRIGILPSTIISYVWTGEIFI